MKIVALVDNSIYGRSVIDHVAWAASAGRASVELVHAISRNELLEGHLPAHPGGPVVITGETTLDQDVAAQRSKASTNLAEAETVLRSRGVSDIVTQIEDGDLGEVAARHAGCDLVVMGKRGERADLARLPLGRNVESIARASNPPVLVVSRAFRPIHRALVAFDLDEGCTAAVDALANAKIVPPMPVLLLHVGQQGEDMRTGLAAAANRLEQAGFDASIELAPGEPQRVIPERAVTSATDLVIMGAFGRSRLKSLIFGSLTSEVVRGTQTPVLLAS